MAKSSQRKSMTQQAWLDTASRSDGWANLFTGLGIANRDKIINTQFSPSPRLTEPELMSMYENDPLAKRIVCLPVHDMVREWLEVEGDTDGLVQKAMKRLNVKPLIAEAMRWARLYGGALAVMLIDDGSPDLEQPLDEENIRSIASIRVYERYRCTVFKWYLDPAHYKFNTPEIYLVSPIGGVPYRVHESRTLRFEGAVVPMILRRMNNGWNESELQAVYERIRGLGIAYHGIEHIIDEFIVGTLTIDNLQNLLATGKESLIQKRLSMLDLSKSLINTILLDKEEQFSRVSSAVGGLDGLIDRLVQALSAGTSIPVTLLMGQSPAGLNATGASDIRFYYDYIAAQQEEKLQPPIERLVEIIMKAKEGEFRGRELPNWSIRWKPLWQPTEDEIVSTRQKQAQIDQTYINTGVLQPEEVRKARFGGDHYSIDTILPENQMMEEGDDEDTTTKSSNNAPQNPRSPGAPGSAYIPRPSGSTLPSPMNQQQYDVLPPQGNRAIINVKDSISTDFDPSQPRDERSGSQTSK